MTFVYMSLGLKFGRVLLKNDTIVGGLLEDNNCNCNDVLFGPEQGIRSTSYVCDVCQLSHS